MNNIEQAKKTLRDAGYFTDNLWHIDDVMRAYDVNDLEYNLSNEDAQYLLNATLTNESVMEYINTALDLIVTEHNEQY
jgi:hypothetical protein